MKAAAELINDAGPPWTVPASANLFAAVDPLTTTDLSAVASTIPAGLPDDLLARTILVYSDLASRSWAMSHFDVAPGSAPPDSSSQLQQVLLRSLANGGSAAARFPSDLDSLISAAQAAPRVTVASPTSPQAAYVKLLVQSVNLANGGCGSAGGSIFTVIPTITWKANNAIGSDGTLDWPDGTYENFSAHVVNGSWQVEVMVC